MRRTGMDRSCFVRRLLLLSPPFYLGGGGAGTNTDFGLLQYPSQASRGFYKAALTAPILNVKTPRSKKVTSLGQNRTACR